LSAGQLADRRTPEAARLTDPAGMAFFYAYVPDDRPAPLPATAKDRLRLDHSMAGLSYRS
jgi:hypothetical protein